MKIRITFTELILFIISGFLVIALGISLLSNDAYKHTHPVPKVDEARQNYQTVDVYINSSHTDTLVVFRKPDSSYITFGMTEARKYWKLPK